MEKKKVCLFNDGLLASVEIEIEDDNYFTLSSSVSEIVQYTESELEEIIIDYHRELFLSNGRNLEYASYSDYSCSIDEDGSFMLELSFEYDGDVSYLLDCSLHEDFCDTENGIYAVASCCGQVDLRDEFEELDDNLLNLLSFWDRFHFKSIPVYEREMAMFYFDSLPEIKPSDVLDAYNQ